MTTEITAAGGAAIAALSICAPSRDDIVAPRATMNIVCVDAVGNVKWRERTANLVTTAGKNDLLDKYLKGSSYTAAWYCVLKGTGTIVAGDTLASHSGWTEATPYSGNRKAISWGTTSAGSNTATAVAISINASATVAGAGIASVDTGTSGVLYNMADFTASRSVASGDTLNVTFTISIT